MAKIKLRFVQSFKDRHDRARFYFRRPGFKRVPLPGLPGSEAFMDAYQRALDQVPPAPGHDRFAPGTVAAAVASYKSYGPFTALAPSTQRSRRNILDRFSQEHGDKRIAKLERRHIESMMAKHTPAMANHFVKAMRGFMAYCKAIGLRPDNPMLDIKGRRVKTDGYYTWTEDDIAAFRKRHAVGTRARLAMEIALNTGQRRGDIIRLGRQHIRHGVIYLTQRKTGQAVEIPVHPDLGAVIAMTPKHHLTILVTERGGPFSESHFSNWFLAMCREAGLPAGCSVHGLRKAACRRLAEAGCSAPEIMAISGHKTLEEVQRYIAAYDRGRAARSGMAKLTQSENTDCQTGVSGLTIPAETQADSKAENVA